MTQLFAPFSLAGLTLKNRIIVAPMCQYSAAENGDATDWHIIHLGHLALSGAALLFLEATAVEAIGQFSPIPIAIQLAHAGRKLFGATAAGKTKI